MSTFLQDDELVKLTGRKFKSHQIEWLRSAGIPFWVNASGHPVVARSSIENRGEKKPPAQPEKRWTPRVIGA